MSIYTMICSNTDSGNMADWLYLRKDYFTQLFHLENGISSAAKKLAQVTKGHWQIENNLHWILDIHFKEDWSKTKKGTAYKTLHY